MRRRTELRSIGSGVLHSFVSRNNDMDGYWAIGKLYLYARRMSVYSVSLNLLEGKIEPPVHRLASWYKVPDFDSVNIRYAMMFRNLLATRGAPSEWLAAAKIDIDFESADARPKYAKMGVAAEPFVCKLSIFDDLGHWHNLREDGWCWPHNPSLEMASARA